MIMRLTASRTASMRIPPRCAGSQHRAASAGFTLIELSVVLVIIALLAAISMPAIKNIRQSNTMVAAGRQLVDDLSLARAKAISERTTVYMLFVPPDVLGQTFNVNTKEGKLGDRLKGGIYTTYALYADRSAGDQPGRGQPRYLTSWRSLPQGVFVATNKFVDNVSLVGNLDETIRTLPQITKPFPNASSASSTRMSYLAFNREGKLVRMDIFTGLESVVLTGDLLPLARGSILYSRAGDGTLQEIDVRESPAGNAYDTNSFHYVRVDGLTGRARVETRALY